MFWRILTRLRLLRGGKSGTPSLAFALAVSFTAVSFLLVALVTGLLYFGLANNLRELSEEIMTDELNVCRALIQARATDSHALREEVEIDSAVRRYQKFYIRVLDDHGIALFTTPGMDAELPAMRFMRDQALQKGHIVWLKGQSGRPYRALIAKVRRDLAGTGPWTIELTMDLSQEVRVLSQHRVWIWGVLVLAAALSLRLAVVCARWGTRPLRDVSQTARDISSSNLSQRIRIQDYPREIADLANSFNSMLQRLEDSFVRLTRFSADIAHELRTPVNNIRGEAEVALGRVRTIDEYRDVLTSCLEEAIRLSDLIESLLFLARSEEPGNQLRKESQDLGVLLADVVDYYGASAAEHRVSLAMSCERGLTVEVDPVLLQRAFGNLISNALAHTSAGGSVALAAVGNHDHVQIDVKDTGSGIPPEALPKVFDRFFRADPARARSGGGTGLGLAIVRQIISLHDGDISIASDPGAGTTVTVTLPFSS